MLCYLGVQIKVIVPIQLIYIYIYIYKFVIILIKELNTHNCVGSNTIVERGYHERIFVTPLSMGMYSQISSWVEEFTL